MPDDGVTERLWTVAEVAAVMGVDRGTVTRWCRSERIEAKKVGRAYRIPDRAVQPLLIPWSVRKVTS